MVITKDTICKAVQWSWLSYLAPGYDKAYQGGIQLVTLGEISVVFSIGTKLLFLNSEIVQFVHLII